MRFAGPMWTVLMLVACGDSKAYDDRAYSRDSGVSAADGSVADTWQPPAPSETNRPMEGVAEVPCTPVLASDVLRPRDSVMSRTETKSAPSMTTHDLFERFASHCRGCHVDQALGGFQVSAATFATAVTEKALMRIRSTGDDFMPPLPIGKPFDEREPNDPIVQFSELLETWLQQGRPKDRFYLDADAASTGGGYFLQPEVGLAMTNLGNCVPDPTSKAFASEQERSAELDAKFERMESFADLPDRLEQIDLFTLDSKELAAYGVVAFAPAYTLWADNAKKIRMVRVPRGQSVVFDKAKQTFDIPANTRFYKTFLKRVIDGQGNESWRKIETRLILSRPDKKNDDGTVGTTALFGTYAWNEQETEAVLVRDPLRNGQPFRDRPFSYYLDEQEAERLIRAAEPDLDDELAAISRTYAIPGSERCIQCHMGATTASFILGFSPLQLMRRPMGEGGVIEPAERDELNQLERLIDYGVITEMTSPEDVTLLEDSQGDRKPRNEHELAAQGYMLGNCAHCHNPRGFPSITAPELRDVLDFMPSEHGGIFQFPLDRYSPRIFRGSLGDVPIPYITPSLYDIGWGTAVTVQNPLGTGDVPNSKALQCLSVSARDDTVKTFWAAMVAPWRSLIYRNVDSPFSYADDFTIFPHMPRNTQGYDCRTRQLVGTWMASIPARWKSTNEKFLAAIGGEGDPLELNEMADDSPQPYAEVLPDDPGYRRATRAANVRVKRFQEDPKSRYNDCPDPELDIIDPVVAAGARHAPKPEAVSEEVRGDQCQNLTLPTPERAHWGVIDLTETPGPWNPRRFDWQNTLVNAEIAVEGTGTLADLRRYLSEVRNYCLLTGAADRDLCGDMEPRAPVTITDDLKNFALTPFPLGLWQDKAECDLSDQPKAASLQGSAKPHWAPTVAAKDEGDPAKNPAVYEIQPGAQVFQLICRNCHGPLADSKSRLADTIADLTGGDTRVANLRDGLFGPMNAPGSNRERVFGKAPTTADLTADDWAARYVVWMGLGGTRRVIPREVLTLVGRTPVLGQTRSPFSYSAAANSAESVGANMLTVAEALCADVLPYRELFSSDSPRFDMSSGRIADTEANENTKLSLVFANGDAEMWERLCTLDNPAPVRVITYPAWKLARGNYVGYSAVLAGTGVEQQPEVDPYPRPRLFSREGYPADALVGDHRGAIGTGITASNLAPWCVAGNFEETRDRCLPLCGPTCGADAVDIDGPCDVECADACELKQRYEELRPDAEIPYCPDEIIEQLALADSTDIPTVETVPPLQLTVAEVEAWTRRGAMNAGLSVFLYLDALARGDARPAVPFDHCEQLESR